MSPKIRRMSDEYEQAVDRAMQRMPPALVSSRRHSLSRSPTQSPTAAALHDTALALSQASGQASGLGPGQSQSLERLQSVAEGDFRHEAAAGLGSASAVRSAAVDCSSAAAAGAALTEQERSELVALREELHRLRELQLQPQPLSEQQQQQLVRLEALELKHQLQPAVAMQPPQLPASAQGAPAPAPTAQVRNRVPSRLVRAAQA